MRAPGDGSTGEDAWVNVVHLGTGIDGNGGKSKVKEGEVKEGKKSGGGGGSGGGGVWGVVRHYCPSDIVEL